MYVFGLTDYQINTKKKKKPIRGDKLVVVVYINHVSLDKAKDATNTW